MFARCTVHSMLQIIKLIKFVSRQMDAGSILKLWSMLEYFLCAAFQLYVFCFFATQIEHLVSCVYLCRSTTKLFSTVLLRTFKQEQCTVRNSELLNTITLIDFYIILGLANCAFSVFLRMGAYGF